jgi:hypothetical protein
MFTLRIVFVGLIAFGAAQSEHGVMLLTDDSLHKAVVVLRQGECLDDCQVGPLCQRLLEPAEVRAAGEVDAEPPKLCWDTNQPDAPAELTLPGVGEEPLVISSGRTLVDGTPSRVPRYADEARDVSWIGSAGKVFVGPGPLRGGCKQSGKACPAWARFWLPGGRLSACHFLHVPEDANKQPCDDPGRLLVFEVGDDLQALANAALLELRVPCDTVTLRMDVGEQRYEAKLRPSGGGCGPQETVTLVVFNEPEGKADSESCTLKELAHFPFFRRFLDPISGLLGKLTKRQPRWTGEVLDGVEGACEADVQWLARLTLARDEEPGAAARGPYGGLFFPEGASECDMATFP